MLKVDSKLCDKYKEFFGPIAQRIEHVPSKHVVAGSIPAGPAKILCRQNFFRYTYTYTIHGNWHKISCIVYRVSSIVYREEDNERERFSHQESN